MNFRMTLVFGGLTLLGTAAHAQLVFGHNYYSSGAAGVTGAFYLDVNTGIAKQLWTGQSNTGKTNGLAADAANGIVYSVNSARLSKWSYGNVGTAPAQINGLYRLGANNIVYATGVDDLAFANGKLYGYTNYNVGVPVAANLQDGIYEIDTTNTTSGTPNMTLKWQHADLAYNLQGLDFNAADGLFYATNTPNDTSQNGIYTIDVLGSGNVVKVADFDPFLTKPDGLAIGGGHLWLTGKQSGETSLKIAGYNLTTHLYDEFFTLDGLDANARGTGAEWIPGAIPVPEPATMAALGFGALALLRRRKPRA